MDESFKGIICLNGAGGFIGKALVEAFTRQGYLVIPIQRKIYKNIDELTKIINGSVAVINIAGASIAGQRWTKRYKNEIMSSRIETTDFLCKAIANCSTKPKHLISFSAVGIYDTIHQHNEESAFFGTDFLSQVCQKWELAALKAEKDCSVSIIRCGIVIGKSGGVIKQLKPIFKLGMGGRLGNGRQSFPFIGLRDLVRMVLFLTQKNKNGIYNAVSPKSINNKQFTKAMAKVFSMPALFVIPAFLLRLMLGSRSEFILKGQNVVPKNILESGFSFEDDDIEQAIKNN